ncbi:hypothetical protein GUITHDRAFT_105877 [Guillardia theta CCMP2712]|uniref:Cytochrome C biogenesis protein transmembrane domain-containing protein n=2 Tax=Guillardia theta TaxID=55529 RepID=L1JIE3_GUITC|nr:hypothetical protein GUITHDRAFT_105877 [Guillardia theta CCMP2712]EKX48273.1 hypothetical protein GUITHDRAFT_105877 [Guillardia theta CCMP2712]|eukprot:XP_005835253.1 hypothetical protein GUITHDRAFT_105877 [Guillardia theta CCMP2712]
MQLDVSSTLFSIEQTMTSVVSNELTHISPTSTFVMLLAGILTSLTPCALSTLPFIVGYIGGVDERRSPIVPSAAFSLGFATSLCMLGLGAALFGSVYGATSSGPLQETFAIVSSALFVVMGLALLDILPLPSLISAPKIDETSRDNPAQAVVRAYIFGISVAFVSSPCATPVLASLLTFIANNKTDPSVGAVLLLAYSIGYTSPVFAAGLTTQFMKSLVGMKANFRWFTPLSGSMLIAYGTYEAVNRIFPA